jgi:hypothetical protein
VNNLFFSSSSLQRDTSLRVLLGDLEEKLLEVELGAVGVESAIICCCGRRVLEFGVLGLGLVDQLLLVFVLVLVVLGLLRRGDGALVREAVEDTQAEERPPENLRRVTCQLN